MGDGWEVVEGDGWESGLDAFDVWGGGGDVEGGLGDEDGEGEGNIELKKALSELNHGN